MFAALISAAPASAEANVPVPFVGCAADGQMGPAGAPAHGRGPLLPASVAKRLAYYELPQLGVLAPRGWHCFGRYGSSGAYLLITPDPIGSKRIFSETNFKGPAIELSRLSGGTSGRFEVARLAARVFPVAQSFVQQVIDEGILPKTEFPTGPYPADKLNRMGDTEVEYETPGNSEGLGTFSRLARDPLAIRGTAILLQDEDMDVVKVDVRLPAKMDDLTGTIISAVERDHGLPNSGVEE